MKHDRLTTIVFSIRKAVQFLLSIKKSLVHIPFLMQDQEGRKCKEKDVIV